VRGGAGCAKVERGAPKVDVGAVVEEPLYIRERADLGGDTQLLLARERHILLARLRRGVVAVPAAARAIDAAGKCAYDGSSRVAMRTMRAMAAWQCVRWQQPR